MATLRSAMKHGDIVIEADAVTRVSPIASGTYGELFLGRHETLGLVAMKTLYTAEKLRTEELDRIEAQIKSLIAIATGPNLVPIHGFIRQHDSYSIVLDYMKHGSLRQLQNTSSTRVPVSLKYRMVDEMLAAMTYLHENCVVHGNLKRDNILIDDDFHVKISDFSITTVEAFFSSCYSNDNNNKKRRSSRNMSIIPPEFLIDPTRPLDNVYDIYSFGIVLWELVTGLESYPSTDNHHDGHLISAVCQGSRPDLSSIPEDCPTILSRIMQECWDVDPEKRPPFHDLHRHVDQEYNNVYASNVENAVLGLRTALSKNSHDNQRTDGTSRPTYLAVSLKNKPDSDCKKTVTFKFDQDDNSTKDARVTETDGVMQLENTQLKQCVITSIDSECSSTKTEKCSTPLETSELSQVLFGLLAMEEPVQDSKPSIKTHYDTDTKPTHGDNGRARNNGTVVGSQLNVKFSDSCVDKKTTEKQRSVLIRSVSHGEEREKVFPKQKRLWKRHSWWSNNRSLPRAQSAYSFEEGQKRSSLTRVDGHVGGAFGNNELSFSADTLSLNSNNSSSLPDLAISSASTFTRLEPELIARIGEGNSVRADFRSPRAAVVSSDGSVFVCDSGNRKLRAFTRGGSTNWKYPPDSPNFKISKKQLFDPREVILTKNETHLVVSDHSSDSVLRISATGALVARYHHQSIRGPWGLAFDSEGALYVVSHKSSCVVVLQGDAVTKVIGKFGTMSGTFRYPTCLSIDSRDHLFVADTRNCRVQVISQSGHFLYCIGDKRVFPGISGIAVDECNNLYVADEKLNYLWVYDVEGECKTRIKRCIGDKKFAKPQGVSVTSDGAVALVDKAGVRLFSCWQLHRL